MLAQRNVNYLVFASLVMISSKLRTYLDHLRWGSEAIPFKIVNDVSFYSLKSALASAFTHRNVNSFISHRTWWFVWLRSAIYYYNERSSYSKSQCQRRRFEDNNKMLAYSCWKPGHESFKAPLTRTETIRLRRVVKPANKGELLADIHRFRDSGTAAECCKYVSHLRKLLLLSTNAKEEPCNSFL